MEKEIVELTKKLISLPSYVNDSSNEIKIGNFIYQYLSQFRWLTPKKQKVDRDRFNLIITDNYPAKLMFCCHMDTVRPGQGWATNPLRPKVKNGKIFGLGAVDMKGSIAALLASLGELSSPTKGLLLLFDVDEEYNFAGMKALLKNFSFRPELAIFTEPTDFKIMNGHRGCITLDLTILGKTGHAADPSSGKNAILGATNLVKNLSLIFEQEYKDRSLGSSTCNLSYLCGGLNAETNSPKVTIINQSNSIPDIARITLDIRPATRKLNAEQVLKIIQKCLKRGELKLKEINIRYDYGPLLIPKMKLEKFENLIKPVVNVEYVDVTKSFYTEAQLMNEKLKVPCVVFGPGSPKLAHQSNENIKIEDLKKAKKIFGSLIQSYCLGG